MLPLLYAGGAVLAAFVGFEVFRKKPRFVGDLAVAGPVGKGDQVEVPVAALIKSNPGLAPMPGTVTNVQGFLPSGPDGSSTGIPAGTTSVTVAVIGANADTLQGPITALGAVPIAQPFGSVNVNRADVTTVYRGTKKATASTFNTTLIEKLGGSQFAGEAERRRQRDKFVG